ncbi:MAG TPA: efflux RND transporter periplasmic adaptor subunit [Luteolibacter sp.]
MTDPIAPPKSSVLKSLIWITLLLVCGWAIWKWGIPALASMQQTEKEPGGRGGRRNAGPVPASVVSATRGDFEEWATVSGTVTPLNYVTVRSRVDGELEHLRFQEGQMVKEGDLLAEIDPRPFQVEFDKAVSQQAKDEALLENAKADLKRYQTLLTQDSIAKQQVDTQASLVRQYEAAIASDASAVAAAKLQLDYTRIVAPLTGRAGLRQIDPGNLIRSSDANGLVTITQLDPIAIVFSVPQERVAVIRDRSTAGETIPVEALGADQSTVAARGKLLTTDNQIDLTSGTLKMKAEFANADGRLFPNQFVTVRVRVNRISNAVSVPAAAIQQGSKGAFVYVVKEGVAGLKRIKTGPTHLEQTQVLEGVAEGDSIITEGVDRLREGMEVRIVTPGVEEPKADAPPEHAQPKERKERHAR